MSRPETAVADLLAVVVGTLPGGQQRAGQRRMAEAVAGALDGSGHLLVQAGTGTGKSVAYLVPALRSGRRVVVSTATLALQSQLCDVDIPRVIDASGAASGPPAGRRLAEGPGQLRVPVAPGRCGHRGGAPSAFSPKKRLPARPTWPRRRRRAGIAAELRRLREWVRTSGTGERDELDPAPHPRAWAQASVSARECVGAARCPYGSECFAERARARAREADIIVTNHALLALDLLAPAAILPDHDTVIVDEAHELADRVTDAATDGLTPAGLRLAERRVAPLVSEDLARAFDEAVSDLSSALAAAAPGRFERLPAELSGALLRLRTAGANAAGAIQPDAEDPAQLRSRRLAESAVDTAARVLALSPADVVWVEVDERGAHVLKVAPLEVGRAAGSAAFRPLPGAHSLQSSMHHVKRCGLLSDKEHGSGRHAPPRR